MTSNKEQQSMIDRKREGIDTATILTGNVLLFSLIGKVFYSYPDPTWINGLITEGVFEEIPVIDPTPEARSGQDLLLQWSRENSNGLSKGAFEDLEVDYFRLFIGGNNAILAPPWESVFVNPDPTLLQRSTMGVRNWYKRFGLEVENLNHEPDDHIGLELAFISHLLSIALDHANTSQESQLDKTLEDLSEFTAQHVFKWAPRWCDLVIEKSRTGFYRGAGLLTKGILVNLAGFLGVEMVERVYR